MSHPRPSRTPSPVLTVPVSQLVEFPRCPLCGKGFFGLRLDAGRVDMKCQRPGCPQHWWSMALHAGGVEAQLRDVVGAELARQLMTEYSLPDSIGLPMFWQLSLTGSQAHHRNEDRKAGRPLAAVPTLPFGRGGAIIKQ
jgi:hypothetical protein